MNTGGSITTIVHGTAPVGNWWQPWQPFPSAINARTHDLYTGPSYFQWPGVNGDPERREAAQDLVAWVRSNVGGDRRLRLICHSHGGNVAMLATRLGLRIDHLVLLGTPIRLDYLPDMRKIGYVHNIYCPWDSVQFGGCYASLSLAAVVGAILRPVRWGFGNRLHRGEESVGQTLPYLEKVLNCAAIGGVGGPSRCHSDLHEWSVWHQNGFESLLS